MIYMIKTMLSITLTALLFIEGCQRVEVSYQEANFKSNILEVDVEAQSIVSDLNLQNIYTIFDLTIKNNSPDSLVLLPKEFDFSFLTDSLIFKGKISSNLEIDSIIKPSEQKVITFEGRCFIQDSLTSKQRKQHILKLYIKEIIVGDTIIKPFGLVLEPIRNNNFIKFVNSPVRVDL